MPASFNIAREFKTLVEHTRHWADISPEQRLSLERAGMIAGLNLAFLSTRDLEALSTLVSDIRTDRYFLNMGEDGKSLRSALIDIVNSTREFQSQVPSVFRKWNILRQPPKAFLSTTQANLRDSNSVPLRFSEAWDNILRMIAKRVEISLPELTNRWRMVADYFADEGFDYAGAIVQIYSILKERTFIPYRGNIHSWEKAYQALILLGFTSSQIAQTLRSEPDSPELENGYLALGYRYDGDSLANEEEIKKLLKDLDFKLPKKDDGTPSTFLELGAGNGAKAVEIALQNPKGLVIAMDSHPLNTMHQIARAIDAGVSPKNFRVILGDITEDLPFADGEIDNIAFFGVPPFFKSRKNAYWNPHQIIELVYLEATRVLSPKGRIVLQFIPKNVDHSYWLTHTGILQAELEKKLAVQNEAGDETTKQKTKPFQTIATIRNESWGLSSEFLLEPSTPHQNVSDKAFGHFTLPVLPEIPDGASALEPSPDSITLPYGPRTKRVWSLKQLIDRSREFAQIPEFATIVDWYESLVQVHGSEDALSSHEEFYLRCLNDGLIKGTSGIKINVADESDATTTVDAIDPAELITEETSRKIPRLIRVVGGLDQLLIKLGITLPSSARPNQDQIILARIIESLSESNDNDPFVLRIKKWIHQVIVRHGNQIGDVLANATTILEGLRAGLENGEEGLHIITARHQVLREAEPDLSEKPPRAGLSKLLNLPKLPDLDGLDDLRKQIGLKDADWNTMELKMAVPILIAKLSETRKFAAIRQWLQKMSEAFAESSLSDDEKSLTLLLTLNAELSGQSKDVLAQTFPESKWPNDGSPLLPPVVENIDQWKSEKISDLPANCTFKGEYSELVTSLSESEVHAINDGYQLILNNYLRDFERKFPAYEIFREYLANPKTKISTSSYQMLASAAHMALKNKKNISSHQRVLHLVHHHAGEELSRRWRHANSMRRGIMVGMPSSKPKYPSHSFKLTRMSYKK